MTHLPTDVTVNHLTRELEGARAAVLDACVQYTAGRITSRQYRQLRERRDELEAELHAATVSVMRRTDEGRRELAAVATWKPAG